MTKENNQSPRVQSKYDSNTCQQKSENFFNDLVLSQLSRAAQVHHRNLELLKSMGYTSRLDTIGNTKPNGDWLCGE